MMRPIPAAMIIATVGMLGFFVYHWFVIAPVWSVFIEGWIWVALNGAAIGWAYQRTMLEADRTGLRHGALFGGGMALTLVPGFVVGLIHGPFPEVASPGDVLPLLPLALLGLPVSIVIAWWMGDWQQVRWPFVVACLPADIMIGGSLATFGGLPVLFLLFAALDVVGGLALAWLVALGGRHPDGTTTSA